MINDTILLGVASRDARRALTCELKRLGYQVEHAFSVEEMKARLFFENFDTVVYDAELPGGPVLDAIFTGHAPKVIIVSSTLPAWLNEEARRLRATVVDSFFAARDACERDETVSTHGLSAAGNALELHG